MVKIQISCTELSEQNQILRMLNPLIRKGAKLKYQTDSKYLKCWLTLKDKDAKA